jgi:hypothetical protein
MGSLYGFEVKSEFPLFRLNSAPGTRGTLTVEAAAPHRGDPTSVLVSDDGRIYYASHELNGHCLLELAPTGEFFLDPERGHVAVEWRDEDADLLEHRIASSAICTLLAMRGDLVLHAAAVQTGVGAVVFCGPTKRGKSTLALTLGEAGHGVLGEDGIAISLGPEGPTAFSGARGVRMRTGDQNGNPRTDLVPDPGPSEPPPCPVAAVVLLDERSNALSVEPLEAARGLALLTPHLVHSGGRPAIGTAFGRLARLLHTVPAFRASLPEDLDALPAAARDLLDGTASRD